MVEEWIEECDPTCMSVLNLRGIYQNRLLFNNDCVTKAGAIEASKKIVSRFVEILQMNKEAEDDLQAQMKKPRAQMQEMEKDMKEKGWPKIQARAKVQPLPIDRGAVAAELLPVVEVTDGEGPEMCPTIHRTLLSETRIPLTSCPQNGGTGGRTTTKEVEK